MILNFKDYLKSCYEHLFSMQPMQDKVYYEKVEEMAIVKAKKEIDMLIQEALANNYITTDEASAMNPYEKGPGKFYGLFKVHKKHIIGTPPPLRPIISGSGSIIENTGKFVEHHIKSSAIQHKSYLQDTPHFIRKIERKKIKVQNCPKIQF